ncbi:MAG: Mov34/MPN/PAD-1 family protein, partial [SAR324 cluster bacterium]|nr:Mov34/MPN/PAD-1 family protein [SAR324 cluster bacterium]
PEELLQGYQLAEKKQLELVGVFHSHPNSTASPSNLDKKFMKANGDIPWIIFSGINTDLRAFKLEQDMENTEEIKIKIMERHFFQ